VRDGPAGQSAKQLNHADDANVMPGELGVAAANQLATAASKASLCCGYLEAVELLEDVPEVRAAVETLKRAKALTAARAAEALCV